MFHLHQHDFSLLSWKSVWSDDYLGDLYAYFLFLSALEIAVAYYLKVSSVRVTFGSSRSGLFAYRDGFAKKLETFVAEFTFRVICCLFSIHLALRWFPASFCTVCIRSVLLIFLSLSFVHPAIC